MTELTAKLITLQIVLDWDSRKIWLVKERISEGTTQFRWFKSEDRARSFAAVTPGSTLELCPAGVTQFTDDGLETLRQQVAILLDRRLRHGVGLSYSHESARG